MIKLKSKSKTLKSSVRVEKSRLDTKVQETERFFSLMSFIQRGEQIMKKLLIMCGTGIATSTVVTNKVKEWLGSKGLSDQVRLYQSKVADEMNRIDDYDIVVSTTVVPDSIKDKVIMGLPLLTGIGTEEMYAEIEKKIRE